MRRSPVGFERSEGSSGRTGDASQTGAETYRAPGGRQALFTDS